VQTSSKKIAFVTGADKGIGFEVTRHLAASGCAVLLGARNKVLGEEAEATLEAEGLDVRYLAIDPDGPPPSLPPAASRADLKKRPSPHRSMRSPRNRHRSWRTLFATFFVLT
jgi:NAD(P)-dependent dehydrogenase (short-subunit alcohol dehydrogenase family)